MIIGSENGILSVIFLLGIGLIIWGIKLNKKAKAKQEFLAQFYKRETEKNRREGNFCETCGFTTCVWRELYVEKTCGRWGSFEDFARH